MKKDYLVEASISVSILAGGNDRCHMTFIINAENSYSAVLELTKQLTLDDVKFIHKKQNEDWPYARNWKDAFKFEIEEIYKVNIAERLGC